MKVKKATQGKATEYIRIYGTPSGMTPSDPESDFAYLENMYIDYEGGADAIESIPGYRRILQLGEEIHSVCAIGNGSDRCLIIHAGNKLYRLPIDGRSKSLSPTVIANVKGNHSFSVSLPSLCFISDGEGLYRINASGEVKEISAEPEIVNCRCGTVYNGRLLLSGNPQLPGRIFSSSNIDGEPFFDGNSVIQEGVGGVNISSLATLDGYLWIFKTADDGGGSIICRRAEGDSYPICAVFSRTVALSSPIALGDELLFLSEGGLMAVKNPTEYGRATLSCRSLPISSMLLRENLKGGRLGVWLGYLVICFGDRFYLADPRSVGKEYGWYLLSGIGGYKDDRRVYRYLPYGEEGYKAHPNTDGIATGEIFSRATEEGKTLYFSVEKDCCYSVYPTEEMQGGIFLPPEKLICDRELMCFTAQGGRAYLFNNDKRGVPPERIAAAVDFTPEEYELRMSGVIHPDFYSFDCHAPVYKVMTPDDDCGQPTNAKDSGRRSLSLELKALADGKIKVGIRTDGQERQSEEIRLSNRSDGKTDRRERNLTASLSERVGGWQKKQISITGSDFASPFGIRRLCCRYTVRSGMKKQN